MNSVWAEEYKKLNLPNIPEWRLIIHGDWRSYEISVGWTGEPHGFISWGWTGRYKILIARAHRDGPPAVQKVIFSHHLATAYSVRNRLNREKAKP